MEEHKPYYPPEWKDDQTMDVLFSPFRDNRDVNPHSWDRKMKFWSDMIFEECRFSKSPIVNLKTLPQRFLRKNKMPVCLETVFQELLRQGKIQSVSDFRASVDAGWLSWGMSTFVKRPLGFTFRRVGDLVGWSAPPNTAGDYIVKDVMTEQSSQLADWQAQQAQADPHSLTRDLVTMESLAEGAAGICPREEDLELLVLQLAKDKKLSVAHTDPEKQSKVLRFQGEKEKKPQHVTEMELEALKLKNTSARLLEQIEKIAEEMERCRSDAKFYLGKGLRNSAKNALRRKQGLSRLLDKRQGALENIEALLQRINDAQADKMVLDAYADGTKTYRNMVSAMGLSPENIDTIMDDVHDVFDVQEEINTSMLQGPTDPGLDVSTADLEAELEDILSGGTDAGSDSAAGLRDLHITDRDIRPSPADSGLPAIPTFDPATPPKVSPVRPTSSRSRQAVSSPTSYRAPQQPLPS